MSGITDPAQEYFKDGLWAWVTGQWKKLVADASNFLQVNIAAQDIDVEVKQTTAADLTPGIMGWDGSAWRKLPILWGFSGVLISYAGTDDAAAGNNTLIHGGPDAGEIWRVTRICAANLNNNPSLIAWRITPAVGTYVFDYAYTPGANVYTVRAVDVIVTDAYDLECRMEGCILNDNLRSYAFGYKMKVAE